ncbi:helix-turn-helix domain containing protein [Kaistia dalseonensis]|uniref:AcrR family transcriptional regulator n=1 Tax=Kaistia dalseonensis TaxID=410840 RepID=A0ABU0H8L3_9HYPH|nr:TetR/AcrR family transcriptional regulator [Kaistia dalseonensis]MCX5496047.1 helix-turn-helix domain containing protein [Kaistia dalseonensis]MDQ0438651.1 AcrR family transcriptional regulator [Kaistia dalseonensis]
MPNLTMACARRTNSRADILAAAEAVIGKHGSAALTIDAVAHEAGRSKGGVLYHFPSKENLVDALIDRSIAEIEHMMVDLQATLRKTRNLRPVACQQQLEGMPQSPHAVALVAMSNVEVRQAYRARLADMAQRQITAGVPRALMNDGLILLFGILGLRLLDISLFQPDPVEGQRARVGRGPSPDHA